MLTYGGFLPISAAASIYLLYRHTPSGVVSSEFDRVWLPILLVVSTTAKIVFSLSPFAPENLVSRDGFSRPVPRRPSILHTRAESDWLIMLMVLTHGISPAVRDGVHILYIQLTAASGQSRVYRWCSPPRVRRHRAISPEISFSNGCCLFRLHHDGPMIYAPLSFPTSTIDL